MGGRADLTSGEMTAPPNFPPFRPSAETWTSYINRFECIMDAANLSDIPSNRKKAYFLTAIQKAINLPGSKPSTAIHYEDAAYEDEYLEEEEEVNRLRTPRPFQKKRPPLQQMICLSCGGNHLRTTCRFRNAVCLNCQRKGHLARICQSPRSTNQPRQTSNLAKKP
ncbi:hypothetical protein E2320_001964 [Naja naja]|nr:hypothetical protein E2320_001964 [Naja naja]